MYRQSRNKTGLWEAAFTSSAIILDLNITILILLALHSLHSDMPYEDVSLNRCIAIRQTIVSNKVTSFNLFGNNKVSLSEL